MKKQLYTFLVLCSLNGTAQQINEISQTDVPGITIIPGNSISGDNLAAYLGNAAALYHEYGLLKLVTTTYAQGQDTVTFQVFCMDNPPSAFGVYSLSITDCIMRNTFGSFSCITPRAIAAINGPLFIYARNNTGGRSGQDLCNQLVRAFIDKNKFDVWYAPVLTQSARAAPFTNTLRYYKGPLGLAKGLPVWLDLFQDISFHMFTMNIKNPDAIGIIASIAFPDESTMSAFLMNAGLSQLSGTTTPVMTSNGLYRTWIKINGNKILFMESTSSSVNVRDFIPDKKEYDWLDVY
jgi:hypothetical protein